VTLTVPDLSKDINETSEASWTPRSREHANTGCFGRKALRCTLNHAPVETPHRTALGLGLRTGDDDHPASDPQ